MSPRRSKRSLSRRRSSRVSLRRRRRKYAYRRRRARRVALRRRLRTYAYRRRRVRRIAYRRRRSASLRRRLRTYAYRRRRVRRIAYRRRRSTSLRRRLRTYAYRRRRVRKTAYRRRRVRRTALRRPSRRLSLRKRLRMYYVHRAAQAFYNPLPGRLITGRYGYRRYPRRGMHYGIDITAPRGTPIKPSSSGVVSYAGYEGGYGNTVVIKHSNGISTKYAHLSRILVGRGTYVTRGTTIGKVGSTGFSTGPHLHFEVRVNGSPVNPSPYVNGL